MVACRGHGTASTWRQAASSAIAALCSFAGVADDGGCQTLSSLKEHPCLSRRIREGSCLWYRFQLLSLPPFLPGLLLVHSAVHESSTCDHGIALKRTLRRSVISFDKSRQRRHTNLSPTCALHKSCRKKQHILHF